MFCDLCDCIRFVNKIKDKVYESWHNLFCDMEEFSKNTKKINIQQTSTQSVQQNTDDCGFLERVYHRLVWLQTTTDCVILK